MHRRICSSQKILLSVQPFPGAGVSVERRLTGATGLRHQPPALQLIDTQIANTAKARRFETDLPALHNDFQLLESSTVTQLIKLLQKFAAVDKDSLARQNQLVDQTEQAIATININQDQDAFVNLYSAQKLQSWQVPRDLTFEECPTWHETVGWLAKEGWRRKSG